MGPLRSIGHLKSVTSHGVNSIKSVIKLGGGQYIVRQLFTVNCDTWGSVLALEVAPAASDTLALRTAVNSSNLLLVMWTFLK